MLNEVWSKVKSLMDIAREVNAELKGVLGDGDDWLDLVSEYFQFPLLDSTKI